MHVQDDLYLGSPSISIGKTSDDNPTQQLGVGPMGRVTYYNIVPATIATANIAALQAQTANVGLVLAAGAGVTAVPAPDGSGRTAYEFDVERAVSLTSGANLSAGTFTISGYDMRKRPMTQTRAGPNASTVNTTKSFLGVYSVVPNTTNAGTVSIGSSDIFGLPFRVNDAVNITTVKWNNTLAADAGTFVAADATSPATATTGDTCGTYTPSANASNGARRLVIGIHLDASQCGASSTLVNAIGVTPA